MPPLQPSQELEALHAAGGVVTWAERGHPVVTDAGVLVSHPLMGVLLIAVPLGLLIGLALGALGGGGSILTVPALVCAIGEKPAQATAASLIVVGLTALTGAAGHARASRVRWLPGGVFGVVGVGGGHCSGRT